MVDAGTDLRDPATDDLVGLTLAGKWTVERRIGQGGMSVVYAARHRNGRRVALKVLRRELSANPRAVRRFVREGYLANKIEHPGAVAILDDDVSDAGDVFLVLELLEGATLSERAARARAEGQEGETLGEVLGILVDLLGILEAAHRVGIVHRDVKPSNVLVTASGAVKLLDFGIARLDDGEAGAEGTRSGATLGTPGFMAPEQARGRTSEVDGRTDVWAVGAVAFWLLTGRQVHEGETSNELVIAAATQPAPSVARFVALPAPVAVVIDRALALDRLKRWPDAPGMRAALEEVRRSLSREEQERRPVRILSRTGSPTAPETAGSLPSGRIGTSGTGTSGTAASEDVPAAEATRPSGGGTAPPVTAGGPRSALTIGVLLAGGFAALLALVRPGGPEGGSGAAATRPEEGVAGVARPEAAVPSPAAASQPGEQAGTARQGGDVSAPHSSAAAPSTPSGAPSSPSSARPRRSLPARSAGVASAIPSAPPVDLLDVRR